MPDGNNVFEKKDLRITKNSLLQIASQIAIGIYQKRGIWDEGAVNDYQQMLTTLKVSNADLDQLLTYIYAPHSLINENGNTGTTNSTPTLSRVV